MKMTNANRAVLFSIIGLCIISILYRYIPREPFQRKTTLYLDLGQMAFLHDENSVLQNLITQFEEENPDIVVVPVVHSSQDLAKKLFDPPLAADSEENEKQVQSDLLLFDMDWLPNLRNSGALESLARFPKDNPGMNSLYESSKVEGNSYAIPLFSNPSFFFYNIDVLKAAGFDRPPKNRDEFLSYCRALKEKNIAGIGLALSADNHSGMLHSGMLGDIYSWFWNSDISFIEDGEPQFSSRPALDTLRFLDTLSRENLISPESFAKTESAKIDEFCSGNIAMMITSLSSVPEIMNRAQFEWGIGTVPSAASYIGNPLFVTESSGIGIYAQSEQQEAAWQFLAFLAAEEQNSALASSYYCIPKNQNIQSSFFQESPQLEKAQALLNAGKHINEFDDQPGVFIAEKSIRDELQKMMSGELSPELTAEAIQKRWE
ncbi:MAG: extracellular solute-binding protein [Treponema sp.]|nr:extracellular solute-binding protein [Treponema sp.]